MYAQFSVILATFKSLNLVGQVLGLEDLVLALVGPIFVKVTDAPMSMIELWYEQFILFSGLQSSNYFLDVQNCW